MGLEGGGGEENKQNVISGTMAIWCTCWRLDQQQNVISRYQNVIIIGAFLVRGLGWVLHVRIIA